MSAKDTGLSCRGRWQAHTKCQSAIASAGENPRPQHNGRNGTIGEWNVYFVIDVRVESLGGNYESREPA